MAETQRMEDYRKEAWQGRRWETAAEVLTEFCDGRKQGIIRRLEARDYKTEELQSIAAWLAALEDFRKEAAAYIRQGQIAERKIAQNEQ